MRNSERLIAAIGEISDKKIESAGRLLGYCGEETGRVRRPIRLSRLLAIAAVIAVLLAMSVGVYAIYKSWSRGLEQAISATEEEKQYAEDSGLVSSPDSVSCKAGGVTVTMVQTAVDSSSTRIVLRFDGIKLPKGCFPELDYDSFELRFDGEKTGCIPQFASRKVGSEEVYTDEDGALELVLYVADRASSRIRIDIGAILAVNKKDFASAVDSGRELHGFKDLGSTVELAAGPWRLQFLPDSNVDARTVQFQAPFDDSGAAPIRAVLSPISITYSFERDEGNALDDDVFEDWAVVGVELDDGTRLIGIQTSGSGAGGTLRDDGTIEYEFRFLLSRIIRPEQVKALVFSDRGFDTEKLPESALYTVPVADVEDEEALLNILPSPITEVHVSTVDELLAAIDNNTRVYLDAESFNLSEASDYGKKGGEYFRWQRVDDGYGLVIHDLVNFHLIGGGRENTEILAEPRWADVLCFTDCREISLMNFTAGHTQTGEGCLGGVLNLNSCSDVRIEGCGFFGCGKVGLTASFSSEIRIKDTHIYDCSYTGVCLSETSHVVFADCSIYRCGYDKSFDDSFNGIIGDECFDISYNGEFIDEDSFRFDVGYTEGVPVP